MIYDSYILQIAHPPIPQNAVATIYVYISWDCRTPLARHTYPTPLKQPTPFPLCQASLNTISGIG